MDTQPLSGAEQLLSHIIGNMAYTLSQREDKPEARQLARGQMAAQTILAFLPVDAVEAMIAGQCVMFHEMIVDSTQTTLRGEPDATRRATRSGIVAMDKAFGANLLRLKQVRAGQADVTPDAAPGDPPAETDIADRAYRHRSEMAPTEARPDPIAAEVGAPAAGSINPTRPTPALPGHRTVTSRVTGPRRQPRECRVSIARRGGR